MEAFLKQFEDLKITLEEITSATNNFNDEKNFIGGGGFGKVYKGSLSRYKEQGTVAFKRLDRKYGQGEAEFLKEITMLSRYRHENLISLLGFCKAGDEMVLVYEYASRGSLDCHIASPALTWARRLKICLDAAKGLSYLHDDKGTHQRLIHRDIKSANILLDDEWNAKVSDFGLSKIGPANLQHSFIVTGAAGSRGYCDPQYLKTYTLTKESDVYSFGVVLFEVLCGTLCYKYSNGQFQDILVPMWIESYKQNKLNEIIFKDLRMKPMDVGSLKIFSDIAYQCLLGSREDRPTMTKVVSELKVALESLEISTEKKLGINYLEMIKTAVPPLYYRSEAELMMLLSQGVLLNRGKTWFSINKNGDHCELISIAECLPIEPKSFLWSSRFMSKFAVGSLSYRIVELEAHVRTKFLSPLVTYTVNLVLKSERKRSGQLITLRYKLKGETKTSVSYLCDNEREDGWLTVELYQFTSDSRIVDLEILFENTNSSFNSLQIEGIEFRPLEKVEHKVSDDGKRDVQAISDCWEEELPANYDEIIKWSKDSVQWTTKKELYTIFCNGFLVNDGQEWFSLDKNGKRCQMLSARASGIKAINQTWLSLPELRFGEALKIEYEEMEIICKIKSQILSSATTYASYLVYKLPEEQSLFTAPIIVREKDIDSDYIGYIYLVSPQTPVFRPKADQNTHNPLYRPRLKGIPQQRNDGWMEVQVWEFRTGNGTEVISVSLDFSCLPDKKLDGLIVQGIEFRPT